MNRLYNDDLAEAVKSYTFNENGYIIHTFL